MCLLSPCLVLGAYIYRICFFGLENESEPVDDVEYEKEDGERDEEELVDSPVFLGQLSHAEGVVGRRRVDVAVAARMAAFLHLVLELVLADDFDVHAVLAGDVPLLLEQNRRVPGMRRRKYFKVHPRDISTLCGIGKKIQGPSF